MFWVLLIFNNFKLKNEFTTAYELISRIANNQTLVLNLRVIALSRLNQLNLALQSLSALIEIDLDENRFSDKLLGQAFPYTVMTFFLFIHSLSHVR